MSEPVLSHFYLSKEAESVLQLLPELFFYNKYMYFSLSKECVCFGHLCFPGITDINLIFICLCNLICMGYMYGLKFFLKESETER